jgi:hypothetical protein
MSDQEQPKGAYINGEKVSYIHYESKPKETFIIYVLPDYGCPMCGMVQCLCDQEDDND